MSSQAGPAAAAPSKSGGKKWLVIGAVLLAISGAGVVWVRQKQAPEEEGQAAPKPVVIDPAVLELEPFVLNLADPTGDRFFRLNLRLVLDQRPVVERLATGLARAKLRDRILSILSKKRATQFTSLDGKESLRTELHDGIASLMDSEPFYLAEVDPAPARVLEVLFTEFLVQ